MDENKGVEIKEGSTLIIYVNNNKETVVEAAEDIILYPNSITMLDGLLLCTDSIKPVEKVSKGVYNIFCWYQDCFYIKDGHAWESPTSIE